MVHYCNFQQYFVSTKNIKKHKKKKKTLKVIKFLSTVHIIPYYISKQTHVLI